jgi:hypothetical protein
MPKFKLSCYPIHLRCGEPIQEAYLRLQAPSIA